MSMSEWVHVPTDELERIVVVQPHFDDAVMGTGYLIAGHAGTTVVTVFGGRPPAYPETPTERDALGGFKAGDDIVALRRDEDVAALGELDPARKVRALAAYRSQLPPLRADHMLDARMAAPVPEQYWRLGRPPKGWEGLVDVAG